MTPTSRDLYNERPIDATQRMVRVACSLLVGVFLSMFGSLAHADRVSLVFDKITVPELAKAAYGELAKQHVIFTSEAVKAQEVVSLSLRDMERDRAIDQVTELLKSVGYSAENRAGVVWIDKSKGPDDMELFYRPKYRPVAYLIEMLSPLFKPGAFSTSNPHAQNAYGQTYGSQGMPLSMSGELPPGADSASTPMGATGATSAPQSATFGSSNFGNSGYGASPYYDGSGYGNAQNDKASDAFVFHGTPQERARLQRLLEQIDTQTPEVLVKAVVFEVSTDSMDKSAISLAAQILSGKLNINVGKVIAGDYSALFKNSTFQAVYDALSTDRRFKAVSSPQLRVQSGSMAQLTVGSDTPVLGAVNYDISGKAIQSVEYKSSGVILNLKPQIRERTADLQISQQISNFIQTTTGVNNSPTLIKRELQTTVGVSSDEVLVIGGLDQNSNTKEKAGFPFLPAWMGSQSDTLSKTEVLLILQATRI